MAVTVTGSKYGALAVSDISNVNRVVVSTTPMVAGDFVATATGARLVALWSSGAAAFKGVAWVRRYIGTNTLELERPFIDPDLVNSLVLSGGMIYRSDSAAIRLAGSGVIEFVVDDVYESQAAEELLDKTLKLGQFLALK